MCGFIILFPFIFIFILSFVFIFMSGAYVALGLTEEVVLYLRDARRKRREAKLAAGQPLDPEDEEVIDDEQEVLEELGANEPADDEPEPKQGA